MIRAVLLLAVSAVQSGCSGEPQRRDSVAVQGANVPSAREADQGTKSPMPQSRIVISEGQDEVAAELVDNDATRELLRMLPLTIDMRDHLRQEKTGNLPSRLPDGPRQTSFSAGTLGLWGSDHFVIYYRSGQVPQPGIIVLGRVEGDVSRFDRPGPVTVRIESSDAASAQ